MKIAIAGSSGFIGVELIKKFIDDANHEVVGLSRRKKESREQKLKYLATDFFFRF